MNLTFKRVAISAFLALCCLAALPTSVSAQVKLEGSAKYRSKQTAKNLFSTQGSVERVSNYSYEDIPDIRVVLGVSRKAYTPGSNVHAVTIAASEAGNLPARTYVDNVPFAGVSNIPKGEFRVILGLINGAGQILDAKTFPKKIKRKSATIKRASKRLMNAMSVEANQALGSYIEASF